MNVHFIAKSDHKRPSAVQAIKLRKALRTIDPDLELRVSHQPGAAACWVQGPAVYGSGEMQDRRAQAVAAFTSIMNK